MLSDYGTEDRLVPLQRQSSVWGRIVGLGLGKSVWVEYLWPSHVGSYAEVERERERKRGREREKEREREGECVGVYM